MNIYACICGVWFLTIKELDDHWLHEHVQKNKEPAYVDVCIDFKASNMEVKREV